MRAPLILIFSIIAATHVQAYSEFQKFVTANSGRPVNCAMCHANHDGPEGTAPGQIGRLTPAEQAELGRARAALEPGANINSPILNAFGNHIVNSLGKKKVLELRVAPAELAKLLPADGDLDGDGIPDAQEYLAGTNPLDKNDGDPWRLFQNNLKRNFTQILLTLAATVAGLYSLNHFLHGFAIATRSDDESEES